MSCRIVHENILSPNKRISFNRESCTKSYEDKAILALGISLNFMDKASVLGDDYKILIFLKS